MCYLQTSELPHYRKLELNEIYDRKEVVSCHGDYVSNCTYLVSRVAIS